MVTHHGSISFSKGYTARGRRTTRPLRNESDFNGNRDSGVQLLNPVSDADGLESIYQILLALCVPAAIMNRYNPGAGKHRCRFYGVIRIHGDVEWTPGLRRSGEEDGEANIKSECNLREAGKPDRISGDIYMSLEPSIESTNPVTWPFAARFQPDHDVRVQR
jgi:hypothetical protein